MTTMLILFAALHLLSLVTFPFMTWRLWSYISRYRVEEGKYTLLFGFVHLRWFFILYAAFVVFWIPLSYLLLKPLA